MENDSNPVSVSSRRSTPVSIKSNVSASTKISLLRKAAASPNKLVGVIDDSLNAVRFSVFTTPDFKEIAYHRIEKETISLNEGWSEQDPVAIIKKIYRCCEVVTNMLPSLGYQKEDIHTIGITNHRDSTVVWNRDTGIPLYNAIVSSDTRTNIDTSVIMETIPVRNKIYFCDVKGMPLYSSFFALKIRWLKDNVPAVKKAIKEMRCLAGSIDSWIVWNLTNGNIFVTDVTNASRSMLMNIRSLEWDTVLLSAFSIRLNMLPQIRSSCEIYGMVTDEKSVLFGKAISGILLNQQASLLGEMCTKAGQIKNNYSSACILMYNTGHKPIISKLGLLTTIAYKLGPQVPTVYALEGRVSVAGQALDWLRDNMRILPKTEDAEQYAISALSPSDVFFVPSFSRLYAPNWRKYARGMIIGISPFTNKYHVVRAALEAICFQSRDIIECMKMEELSEIKYLNVDGDLSANNTLMQLQSDILGVPVTRSRLKHSSALGVAVCAGQAEGIELCIFEADKRPTSLNHDIFYPANTDDERDQRYAKWKKAVKFSLDWGPHRKPKDMRKDQIQAPCTI